MRPRLVLVGAVLLTLTGGAFASLYLPAAPGPSTSLHTFTSLPAQVGAGSFGGSPPITLVNASAGTLHLAWQSSVALNVSFGRAPPCDPRRICPVGPPPLVRWTAVSGGSWDFSGPVSGPYYLSWLNGASSSGSIGFTVRESITTSQPFASLTSLLVDASLFVLSAIGAVAVFLGVFLRKGVYRGPAALVSQSADDASVIAAAPPTTGPRTGPSAGGSAESPRTPAAPPGKAPPP